MNQYEQDSIVAQVVGCTGIEISVAYGINRPADEVLNEYIEDLSADSWNLPYWNDDPKEIPSFYKGDAYVHVSFTTPPDMIATCLGEHCSQWTTQQSIWLTLAMPFLQKLTLILIVTSEPISDILK